MSNPLSVREVLNKCEAALDTLDWVDVGFAWEVRLWAAIRREYGEEGIFRHGALSFLVAASTLPAWETVRDKVPERVRELPTKLLSGCQEALLGKIHAGKIISYDVERDIAFGQGNYPELGNAPCALPAAHACAFDVRGTLEEIYTEAFLPTVWDESHFDRCKEEDADWEWWSAASWTSIVVGGLKGMPLFDPGERRSFWLHWLHEEVPFCLGHLAEIKRRIASVAIDG